MPRWPTAAFISIRCTSPATDTDLHMQGALSLEGSRQLDLAASGSINLKLAETSTPI
jgi:hypothetical protein